MKPQQVLTQLEREPVVFFGCTWSEIKRQLNKSLLIGFIIALFVAFALGSMGFPFQITFAVFMLIFVAIALLLTKLFLSTIAGLRAGKPLFYEKHHGTYKTNRFIQPQKIVFQRERNEIKK